MTNDDIGAAIAAVIGAQKIVTDDVSLNARRFDQWAVKHLRDWRGEAVPRPGWVVRPESVEDVQAVARLASGRCVPIVPFGLGSGVCGGIEPDSGTILLDMGAMNRVRHVDVVNGLASLDAGVNGMDAEKAVSAHGMTIGHWPQSIAISSVGGWISTRASGQFSTAYGNIEDIVYSIEAVLPDGRLVTLGKAPRAAAGPDLRHVLMGAEGTMGIVTGVTLTLREAPQNRTFTSFHVADMDAGFELQRRIVRADWRPPVMRQYDAREVKRLFAGHERGDAAMLLMMHEGPAARVAAETADIAAIARDQGAEQGTSAPGEEWIERRNHVPAWTALFEQGLVADTIEISAKWSDIGAIYRDAIAALREIPDCVNASAHSSHVYSAGINLYFSFAIRRSDTAELEPAYFEAWRKVMEATTAHGGGVAHHHGSGRIRRDWLVSDLGREGVDLLRALKHAVDPAGIMNPGNLLPDA